MVSEELLPRDLDCKNIAIEIAERADGMFLWATLFSNYLQSYVLTVDDRLEAVNQYSYLADLDALYTVIWKGIIQVVVVVFTPNLADYLYSSLCGRCLHLVLLHHPNAESNRRYHRI